jgi:hypothetical protein
LLVETFRERKLDASLSKSSDRAAFGTWLWTWTIVNDHSYSRGKQTIEWTSSGDHWPASQRWWANVGSCAKPRAVLSMNCKCLFIFVNLYSHSSISAHISKSPHISRCLPTIINVYHISRCIPIFLNVFSLLAKARDVYQTPTLFNRTTSVSEYWKIFGHTSADPRMTEIIHISRRWSMNDAHLEKDPASTRFQSIRSSHYPVSVEQKLVSFRIPKKAVLPFVAEQLTWLRSFRISPSMQRPCKYSHDDYGHGREQCCMKWDK